jgi:hypothetical protein
VALGPVELAGLAESAGLEMGAIGFTEGDGPFETGVEFGTVPSGAAVGDGAGLAVGEAPAAAGLELGVGEIVGGRSFISSRWSPLWVLLFCAYRIERTNVRRKNRAASQLVIFVSTLVVCAPKMFSVTPPPNAAPRPSLFGRCIKITRTINNAMKT